MRNLLEVLTKAGERPLLFEAGETEFWNDPHISKSMLEAHLNPNHDAASRKPEIIDQTVLHWLSCGVIKPGYRVLDLGCGPGLYAERLCEAGIEVVGLDISERSIEYALKVALAKGLKAQYHCMNFFDMDYTNEFDAVIQVYGELCTFSDEKRDTLLQLIKRALKKEGIFIFDVSTRAQRTKAGLKNAWYVSEGGFWRQGSHLVLGQGFDYPQENLWLDQYSVIDEQGCKVYRNWFRDYSQDSIGTVLRNAGFEAIQVWNDLTGDRYVEGGDWIALVAKVSK